jgi:signal transduction histidine kinase
LRSPLTAIILSIQNLEKYRKNFTEQEIVELISIISHRSQRLGQMIDDLLILSRIEAKKLVLKWEKFYLKDILQEVLTQSENRQLEKQVIIVLDIEPGMQVLGDIIRFGQIFRILIDNAIKYSKENSLVFVNATDHQKRIINSKEVQGALIEITDFGIGIQEKDLPFMFQRFFRSEDVKDIQGTGLGLSIAKDLVLLHHGQIYLKSIFGKGTTFSVFFPTIEVDI